MGMAYFSCGFFFFFSSERVSNKDRESETEIKRESETEIEREQDGDRESERRSERREGGGGLEKRRKLELVFFFFPFFLFLVFVDKQVARVPSPQNFVSPKLACLALIGRNSTRICKKKKKKPDPGKTSRIGAGFCSILHANKSYVCSLASNLNY
jgi:hypothetical protein